MTLGISGIFIVGGNISRTHALRIPERRVVQHGARAESRVSAVKHILRLRIGKRTVIVYIFVVPRLVYNELHNGQRIITSDHVVNTVGIIGCFADDDLLRLRFFDRQRLGVGSIGEERFVLVEEVARDSVALHHLNFRPV